MTGLLMLKRNFRLQSITLCALLLAFNSAHASVTDLIVPEEWSYPEELSLPQSADSTANAHASYMQAIIEEEGGGPDSSISSKLRVLNHDPGFSALAIDVSQHHLRRGDFAAALAVLKDATTANPEDPSPLMVLASIYLRHLEKPTFAEKYALRLRKISPDNPAAIELLCDIYRAARKTSRIEPLLESASESNSTDPAYWIALAEMRLRELSKSRLSPSENHRAQTFKLASKAVELGANDPAILSTAGDLFALLGKTTEAVDVYRKALGLDRCPEGVQEKLANCLLELGDEDAALGLLQEIVAQSPLNLRAYDQLAGIHLAKKNYSTAVTNMRQAMRLAPVNPSRFEDLIRTSLLAGDHATAIQFSAEAEQRFPYLTGFTVLHAVALSQAGDHLSALSAFERALVKAANTNPELLNSGFYMSYGTAAERAGHYAKAAELLQKSIALAPNASAEACNYLGYMWADRNERLDEAESLIRRALEFEPDNAAYIDSLGWVLFRQGRYEEALPELLRAASASEPADAVILEHVGDAYAKLNRTAEALQYWRKSLHLDQENASLISKIDTLTQPVARQPSPSP